MFILRIPMMKTAALLWLAMSVIPLAAVPSGPTRWTEQKATEWYAKQPWFVGCNFIPSTAINQLEMWQADTFDPQAIDRELGMAAGLGMNLMRVFLHDLLWVNDGEEFLKRTDQYLAIADKHGIKTMFVLCDSVWNPHPEPGKQPDPLPRVHNSGWVQSPHIDILRDPAKHDSLKPYVQGVIRRYKDDPRVVVWDLYNEPGNHSDRDGIGTAEKQKACLMLLEKLFAWARGVNPSQPITSGVWVGEWFGPKATALDRFMLEHSDIITFHSYEKPERFEERINSLLPIGRPLICTEYLARGTGNTFEAILPILQRHKAGAINWGLVAGKTQTQYPWNSWNKKYTAEPDPWHHEIFRPDGTPYRAREAELIRSLLRKQ